MRLPVAGIAAGTAALLACGAVLAEEHPADVCLEVAVGSVDTDEWTAVAASLSQTVAERTALFPYPSFNLEPSRLDISSGHLREERGYASCLEPSYEWTARFGRAFLEAGADQMLAEAPTTPGIDSAVTIEWDLGPGRLRTTLEFAGPFDIPNGTCWVDEELSVEGEAVKVSSEQGVRTSPFAEGACERFFDHLPDGGAGEQAVTLLPAAVELPDGGSLRFAVERVAVLDDALTVSGALARD